MPLGIVSDEDFLAELQRTETEETVPSISGSVGNNITNIAEHKDIIRGRGDKKEIPQEVREIIAAEAIAGGRAADIAEAFGISQSSVSAYKNDATSTASYNQPNKELKRANDLFRKEIVGSARSRLLQALENITPDKLKDAKLRDVASVAKDMSSIINNMEGNNHAQNIGAQFVFHVPRQRAETEFDVIEVSS